MNLVNLTPHAIHIFHFNVPDRIEPDSFAPVRIIEPASDRPARANEIETGQFFVDDLLVISVDSGGVSGLPDYAGHMDSRDRTTWFIVSRPVAMSKPDRRDLLVPYSEVRNMRGSVIGCRMLARLAAPIPQTTRPHSPPVRA